MPTVVELIWLLFLFVGTVLGARLKTSTWLLMDTVISFLFILPTFPFATESQRMETEGLTVDTAHGWLAQLYLGYALMPSVAWFGLRHSSFQICELALLSARVLGAGLGAVLMAVAHWQHNFFNSTHLYYAVLGNVAWALVNAVQLYKIDVSKRKQLLVSTPSKVNFYLQIDVAFSLLYALPDLLAPRFALSLAQMEPDGLHVHLLQVSAALHIGTAALSGLALYFRDNEEKKAVLLGRVVIMLLLWAVRTFVWVFADTDSFYSYFLSCTAFFPFFPAYLGMRQS